MIRRAHAWNVGVVFDWRYACENAMRWRCSSHRKSMGPMTGAVVYLRLSEITMRDL